MRAREGEGHSEIEESSMSGAVEGSTGLSSEGTEGRSYVGG